MGSLEYKMSRHLRYTHLTQLFYPISYDTAQWNKRQNVNIIYIANPFCCVFTYFEDLFLQLPMSYLYQKQEMSSIFRVIRVQIQKEVISELKGEKKISFCQK